MNNLAFRRFLDDNDLSVRQFANYCRGTYVGKSTIFRLANPEYRHEVKPEYLIKIMPILIKGCQIFMEKQGKTAEDIDRTLATIFEEDYQPMICERYRLDTEHLDFFGLDRDPFALESDPRAAAEVYTNPSLDRIVRRVEDAVKFQGFIAVLGPVGAGKTILKCRIAERLKKQGKAHLLWPRFAEMGKLNAGGILHYVLEEFGQRARMRLPLAQRQLERHLEQLSEAGRSVALCFDECHRLNDAALTALKNFYELGTGGYEKYLGLVLFGQPSFKRRLETVEFREIAERVEVLEMPSFAKHAADYLTHRVQLAGGSVAKLFDAQAIKVIASRAETPLGIGNLANKALISTYEKGEPKVLARFLERDAEPAVRQLRKVANA